MELGNDQMHERLGAVLEPVHQELVEKLTPSPGERWLDIGSGAGSVALRAARAGAEVTAVDSAEPLLEQARENAEVEGLGILGSNPIVYYEELSIRR